MKHIILASKPDDVPNSVWVSALNAGKSATDNDGFVRIARAILAAKAEEREACAKIADEREAICADAVAKIDAGELYLGIPTAAATEGCARLEASHIARLIRKRGEA